MPATPVQSFLGGLGLALPVHSLLLLNGKVFGISGFIHRGVKGDREAIAGIAGLIFGGTIVGLADRAGTAPVFAPFPIVILSGFLVGLGTKMSNGCTSGHMICGLSRLSRRSLAATATFFSVASLTAQLVHAGAHPTPVTFDWSLGASGLSLLGIQAASLLSLSILYITNKLGNSSERSFLRTVAAFITAVEFAVALRLSNLTEPTKVLGFLMLPWSAAFDASLAFLAAGALPLTTALYRYCRGDEKPRLGGGWCVPTSQVIDRRLVLGAAAFGMGWGIMGICPGPGLVNFGRALVARSGVATMACWLLSVVVGGLVV
ncbi:hypothetical protein FISHEDRAFT_67151 [Fistulina hepatica ATCC 64428]|uniref:Sulphur transport domain-containing protein n=1 Tax=Fistulina hepatica ATCC 64428 TaxID=1128425 RepID=A0A0D7A2T7_9AGAR|nr:hypothetical protein FISHEDRAFT_67151 [Fistulina hepatica ATCC 64428]